MSTTQTDLEDFTTRGSGTRPEPEVGGIAADKLHALIDRAENIQERIKEEQEQLKDLFLEAKSGGWDVPTIKAVLKERAARAKNSDKVDEAQSLLDLYRSALSM